MKSFSGRSRKQKNPRGIARAAFPHEKPKKKPRIFETTNEHEKNTNKKSGARIKNLFTNTLPSRITGRSDIPVASALTRFAKGFSAHGHAPRERRAPARRSREKKRSRAESTGTPFFKL